MFDEMWQSLDTSTITILLVLAALRDRVDDRKLQVDLMKSAELTEHVFNCVFL